MPRGDADARIPEWAESRWSSLAPHRRVSEVRDFVSLPKLPRGNIKELSARPKILFGRCHAPHGITHIIDHHQCALFINGNTNGPALGPIILPGATSATAPAFAQSASLEVSVEGLRGTKGRLGLFGVVNST